MGTLYDPATTAEFLAALDATPGDARHDPARPALTASSPGIVCFVGMQFVQTAEPASTLTVGQIQDGVQHFYN